MQVYSSAHSLYCAKLRIILRHKQLAFTEVSPPGGGGSPEYLARVPSGNIPALVDGDLILTDSEAIAEYLEERHPEPSMFPATITGRALARERARFADTRLEPALRLTFPHVDPATRDAKAISDAQTQINLRLKALGVMLERSPLPRDTLWMGDPGTIVTLAWIDLFDGPVVRGLHWPDAVRVYQADMLLHPAVVDELESYRPAMLHYMRGKNALPS